MEYGKNEDRYGIKMRDWCAAHEAYIAERLAAVEAETEAGAYNGTGAGSGTGTDSENAAGSGIGTDSGKAAGSGTGTDSGNAAAAAEVAALLAWHEKKLAWLQHERLVHLIVTLLTFIGELFLIGATFFPAFKPLIGALMLGVLVVLGFYTRHYFFLENTVQHWYRVAERLAERLRRRV